MEFFAIRIHIPPISDEYRQVRYHSGNGWNVTDLEGAKIYGSWRRVKQAWSLHFKNPPTHRRKQQAEIVKFTVCGEQVCDHTLSRSV